MTTDGDPIAAPSLVGPASIPDYAPMRDQATYNIPDVGITYAGQADDPFFADLRVFDLLYGGDASLVGADTLAGYNVNTVALQVPSDALAINGDAAAQPGHRGVEHDRTAQCERGRRRRRRRRRSSRSRDSATRSSTRWSSR